jgi:Type I phosphodiesterase / nucleotide pyrophosphatase
MALPRTARVVRSLTSAVTAVMLASAAGGSDGTPAASRVILVSLDGGADWLIDRWMAQGKAPAFSKIAAEGGVAEAMIAVWPSLTAPAHAALWTGAPPRIHGIGGNSVPRLPASEHTLLDQQSGYLSTVLAAEPIWISAARAGRQVLVLRRSRSRRPPSAKASTGPRPSVASCTASSSPRALVFEQVCACPSSTPSTWRQRSPRCSAFRHLPSPWAGYSPFSSGWRS